MFGDNSLNLMTNSQTAYSLIENLAVRDSVLFLHCVRWSDCVGDALHPWVVFLEHVEYRETFLAPSVMAIGGCSLLPVPTSSS